MTLASYTVSIGSFTTPHLSSYSASRANDRILLSATCLPLGQYTVTLTNQDTVLWTNLDRIVYSSDASNCDAGITYAGPSYSFVTGTTTSAPSGTLGSTTGPATGSPTKTDTQTPNPGNNLADSQSLGAGPIAGIVVGIVVAALLAIIAFFLWKRHNRQQQVSPPPASAWTGATATAGAAGAIGAASQYTGKAPVMPQNHNALGYIPPDQLEQQWTVGGIGAAVGLRPVAGAGRAPMIVEPYGGGNPGPYYQQPIALSSTNPTAFSGSSTYLNHPSTPPLPSGAGVPERSSGVMSPPPQYQYPAQHGVDDNKQLLRDLQEKLR